MASALAMPSQGSPRGSGVFSGDTQRGQRDKLQNQQETLYSLASDTGGRAMLDTNDLTMGIRQASATSPSYYILGFYTTNAARDGRYRRVKVSLRDGLQAKLDYRSGYFAPKDFKDFTSDDKERQLEQAFAVVAYRPAAGAGGEWFACYGTTSFPWRLRSPARRWNWPAAAASSRPNSTSLAK